MAQFLFILTLIGGVAFANEGGDAAIKEKGFQESVKVAVAEADTSTLTGNYGNE